MASILPPASGGEDDDRSSGSGNLLGTAGNDSSREARAESIFEFLLTPYAIVAGLGVSLLVRSIGQMIEARDRVRLYWVHTCWLALIFVAHVVSWFALWRFSLHAPWTVLQALLLAVLLCGAAAQQVIEGQPEFVGPGAVRAVMAVILLPGIVSRRPAVHAAQAVTLIAIMIVAVSYVARPIG